MYTTEIKMLLMQKNVRIGEELRGIQVIRHLSNLLNFKVDYRKLLEYSLDVANIFSFETADLLYAEMLTKFCPAKYYDKVKLNIYKNESYYIIDEVFSLFEISTDFLEFAFNDFLEFLVEEIVYQLTVKKEKFDIVDIGITIPIEDIEVIYEKYSISKEEKIEKFTLEMIVWITYNRIASITRNSFEMLTFDNGEEDCLYLNFKLYQV